MINIPYTNIDTQIEKLKSQNLIINNVDFAKSSLELFGYSNLIKSYRDPYIIKTGSSIEYRPGVKYEQIYSLYILDKNLRNSVMAAMQDLEEHIKATAASVISESFGTNQNDYLSYKNYRNIKKRKHRFTLPGILDTLKDTLDTDKNPIHHYSEKYGNVPPWILFKSLYFSTIVNFINLFKYDEALKMINKLYVKEHLKLSDDEIIHLMKDTLFICLEYRNIAAHGGRIYNHKIEYKLNDREIFGKTLYSSEAGFNQLLFLLKLFNYQTPYQYLHYSLKQQLTRHFEYFPQDINYLSEILHINIVDTDIVFITKNSNKYHIIPHCSGIKNFSEIEFDKAKEMGYIPCKRCAK